MAAETDTMSPRECVSFLKDEYARFDALEADIKNLPRDSVERAAKIREQDDAECGITAITDMFIVEELEGIAEHLEDAEELAAFTKVIAYLGERDHGSW